MKKFILIIAKLFFSLILFAQAPQSWTSAEMYQAIRKLNVLGSVLYVAAHPDDENTRLITYFSKDRLYRTGYLSITRGDGGQNLIGDEQGIDLGLIRTQELLAARRIDGGEQFFTRAYDFGYSKSPDETLAKWDKEKILGDVVWVIRKFQPDVIINRFPATGEGGHGHHTASAILAEEAFAAAANPARFPEQLKYVNTWQAKRILWNTFSFGGTNTTSSEQLKFDVGGYSPLLGKSYGEIAAASRSQHKSQGFGVPATRGEALEYFRSIGGSAPNSDIFEGVDVSWQRAAGASAIEKIVSDLAASFDFLNPEKSVSGLVKLYKALQQLQDGFWKTIKLNETKQLIVQCSGLFIDATSPQQMAVQTDSLRVNFSFNNRLGVAAILKNVSVPGFDTTLNQTLSKNKNLNFGKQVFINESISLTQPYWLIKEMEEGYFNVVDQQKIGQPDADPVYFANAVITIEGQDFEFNLPVKYKFTDPVRGELYQPLVVIPTVEVSVPSDLVIHKIGATLKINPSVLLKANTNQSGVNIYNGDQSIVKSEKLNLEKGQSREIEIVLNKDFSQIKESVISEKRFYYKPGAEPSKSIRRIQYDHIPDIHYFKNAVSRVLALKIETYNKKIGYIAGAGDKVPEALELMGYEVNRLTEKEVSQNDLTRFDAIITGVRAYNTVEWIGKYYDKLMKYVEQGGNLIVQYNTNNFLSTLNSKIGPYSFNISRTRVTDENSPVTFLKPEHPVFNFPNKITQYDFKGWIQERSIYHADKWDKNFETVLSMNDPEEKQQEGSLIIAKHGKGVFVYTGLVFFRELPAGVPGAYRLLANIIALNKKKAF